MFLITVNTLKLKEEFRMSSKVSLSDNPEILSNYVEKSSAVTPDRATDERENARFTCIRAYEAIALQQPDPLRACLETVNCGIMDIVSHYQTLIEQSFASGIKNIADLRQLAPAMDSYLKLVRQTDRFAMMEIRMQEANKRTEAQMSVASHSIDRSVPTRSEEMTI
jgi:hypothetical protein